MAGRSCLVGLEGRSQKGLHRIEAAERDIGCRLPDHRVDIAVGCPVAVDSPAQRLERGKSSGRGIDCKGPT